MRLIDADKYLEYLDEKFGSVMMTKEHPLTLGLWEAEKIVRGMIDLESIEAEPVVHGEWVEDGFGRFKLCGNCGGHRLYNNRTYDYENSSYCPWCGAKMKGGD